MDNVMESEQVAMAMARSSDMGDFDPSDVQAALLASVQASAASKLHVRAECLQRGESSVGSEASCASTRNAAAIPGSVERPRRKSRLSQLGSRSMPIEVDGVGGGQVTLQNYLAYNKAYYKVIAHIFFIRLILDFTLYLEDKRTQVSSTQVSSASAYFTS